MHKRIIICFILLVNLLTFMGCSERKTEEKATNLIMIEELSHRDRNISSELSFEGSMDTHYAKGFAVDYYQGGYKVLTVADESQFLLVPEGAAVPQDVKREIVILQQPMDNLYIAATAVMDIFRELNATQQIRFSGQKAEGWYIKEAREAMEAGEMLYAGKYNMPDYELILSEGCSLAIENTMISHSPEVSEKLKEFGIPVMIDYSSYDSHPLGRVEWVKFYGALLGKEEAASRVFKKQEEILERISKEKSTEKTVAFFYITASGTVNVRKTTDYVPRMIELAGGTYIFENLEAASDNKSSVNMTMEDFYGAAKEADYLIYNSNIAGEVKTVEELLGKSEMLKDFKAVKEGNVWCTTNDVYQQSMSIGYFMEDIHRMLSGEPDVSDEMKYIYLLK